MTEFFVGDLHFGDPSVLNPKNNPRGFSSQNEMRETITRRWNEVVRDEDIVWVVGDVAKRGHEQYVADLKGDKRLVGGNHDGDMTRFSGLFTEYHGCKYLPGLLLTHVPVHPTQVGQYTANVHGHLHGGFIKHDRYLCVSVDQTGFRPISRAKVDWLLARSHLRRYPMPEPTRVRAA